MSNTNAAIRLALDAAFKRLRRQGFLARANFICCGSCGHYELGQKLEGTTRPGYVFWHAQEHDHTFGRNARTITPDNALHLQWSAADGNAIVAALVGNGLIVSWDGTDAKCIAVTGHMLAAAAN